MDKVKNDPKAIAGERAARTYGQRWRFAWQCAECHALTLEHNRNRPRECGHCGGGYFVVEPRAIYKEAAR